MIGEVGGVGGGLLLLLVGGVGVALGLAAGVAFRVSERAQVGTEPTPAEPEALGEGATAVLGAIRQAAVVVGPDDRVVRATAAAQALGLVRGDRVAHDVLAVLVGSVQRDGDVLDRELELPRGPVGTGTIDVFVRAAPLGARHVLLLAEDRTEARRVEAVRRDFVVNVSHELKTPVGAISLLAETVADAADDPEAVRRFAGRMQTESARLSALVQEIIELSRLQAAGALAEAEPVPIPEVVADATDRARTTATARQIAIDVGAVPPVAVFGDHDLLVTAVRNLLDNAVAYSDAGTRVAVATTVRRTDGLVEIAVVDQGAGIPEAEQQRVFERFYRVDPARSRDTGGTGLGLSIVKHVAADHGGDVTVWSRPGHGSTFTIRLPLADPAAPDPSARPTAPTRSTRPTPPTPPTEGDR